MIVFAGDAFTQLPITSDYISAKMFLESINPSLISKQGTAIGAAINLATRSFTPQEGVGRAIIVITDGENHEGGAVEAAKAAAEKGIQNVYGFYTKADDYVRDFAAEAIRRNIVSPYQLIEVKHRDYEKLWFAFCDEYFSGK